jgi:phosphatidylglycerol:prolipoprotein diacylglycerol transferase
MQPEIELGPLTLQTFGICLAAAFVSCGILMVRRLRELGRPVDWAYEAVFAAFAGGIVGARLDYLIQNWDRVSGELPGALFSGTGLVFFGGLLGGIAGVVLWARWRGYLGWELADMAGAAVALGYTVGRIGCQISGDGDYGDPSSLPWAMSYPEGTVPTTDEVHPTPVYESLAMGLVTLALWHLRDRVRPGALFGLYLLLGGVERFLVEFIRRNEPVLAGLTVAQLFSLLSVAAGLALLARGGVRARAATA